MSSDAINPAHYTSDPSGVECVEIAEHLGFLLGNAWKYLWRAGLKTVDPSEDFAKAAWYLNRELQRRTLGISRCYPLNPAVVKLAYKAIDHAVPRRKEVLQAIIWAANNNDVDDVKNALEATRELQAGIEE